VFSGKQQTKYNKKLSFITKMAIFFLPTNLAMLIFSLQIHRSNEFSGG
jgi:hypothetical protein